MNQEYNLNITPDRTITIVRVSQFDVGSRTIVFNLQKDGEAYTIPDGSVVSVRGIKPDATVYEYECTYDGSTVYVPVYYRMTSAKGRSYVKLRITNGEEILGTNHFYVECDFDPVESEVESVTVSSDTIEAISDSLNYKLETSIDYDIEEVADAILQITGSSVSSYVYFWDYDGTLLYSYSADEFMSLTELPENPEHDGLTAQGWNWTLAQINAQLLAYSNADVNVGQMYVTESESTEIDITLQEERLSPYLSLAINGSVTVDWGDDSTGTISGTSLSTQINTLHEYASGGDYTITITPSGYTPYTFVGTTSYTLLNKKASQYQNCVYANCVKAIRLGKQVYSLGNYAFYNCYSLETITIPNTMTSLGSYPFYNCYSLKSVTIPSGVTEISQSCFSECHSMSSVSIPDGVTDIDSQAFNNCKMLGSVTLPDTVENIGSSGFSGCTNLTSLVIPNNLTSLENSVFSTCNQIKSFAIPDGITSIGTSTFSGCQSLEYIDIPDSVTSIGNNAFVSCYRLKNVTIPDGVTTIGSNAFQYCYGLESIDIPDTVTSIGVYAFSSCWRLQSITIPSSVTALTSYMFNQCFALKTVTLPDTITASSTYLYQNCASLTSVTIPSNTTIVYSYSFSNCYSLASITIPSNISTIQVGAFQNCYGMKEYHLLPTTPPTLANTNAFSNIPSDCVIYVPSGTLSAYQSASNWSTYKNYMVEES